MQELNSHSSRAGTAGFDMPRAWTQIDGRGVHFIGTPLAPRPDPASDVAIRDWDDLLGAVKARLRLTASEWLASPTVPRAHDEGGQFGTSLLDCVAAIEHLQTTLTQELGRRQQLELEVVDAQAALAQAVAELAGTQAGEKRAQHQSMHDSLTALPNRLLLNERLQAALAPGASPRQEFALLHLDLDGFKPINDAHGHDLGDELLRIVAARLMRAVRAKDTVCRLEGDKFALLLADVDSREQLSQVACKLFDAVTAPLKIGKLKLSLCPSVGIAMYPGDGTSIETLLKNGDTAMHHAKRHRSGYAFFDATR